MMSMLLASMPKLQHMPGVPNSGTATPADPKVAKPADLAAWDFAPSWLKTICSTPLARQKTPQTTEEVANSER